MVALPDLALPKGVEASIAFWNPGSRGGANTGMIRNARTIIPENNLLDLPPMARLLLLVDACVRNVRLCVVRHAIHDTEEAGHGS